MPTTPDHPTAWSKVNDDVRAAVAELVGVHRVLPVSWAALCDAIPGQPGASDPSATRVSGSRGDDGPDDAEGPKVPPSSKADTDLAELRRRGQRIRRDAAEMARILGNYATRLADDHQRARTAGGDLGCESCARIKVDAHGTPGLEGKGKPWWQPTKTTVEHDGRRFRVCQWCFRWFTYGEPVGVVPPRKALLRHAERERVSKADWYKAHPPAKAPAS